MRYFYEFREENLLFGEKCAVSNPMCRSATIFSKDGIGLGVVQERFDLYSKSVYWDSIDNCIANDFLKNAGFDYIFQSIALKKAMPYGYPIFSVREIMWKLRMKPLKKEWWEVDYPNFNSRELQVIL